jgi:hypothetical protein
MMIAERDARDGTADGFVELPAIVYANDPAWIPEETPSIARAFDAKNPWLATREGRTWSVPGKARVAAFFDPALRVDGESCAFFGFWESIGDRDAARAVMDRARAWAKARGAARMFGPVQFSTANSYRLRTSAELGALPLIGEPYNPPSYPAELESLGFSVRERYTTTVLTVAQARAVVDARTVRRMNDATLARGYRVEPLTIEAWTSRLPELHAVVEEAFKANFAYTPMRFEEFAAMGAASFVRKFDPASSLLAYAPDGRVVGFALNALDFSPLVVQGAGDHRVASSAIDHATHAPMLPAPVDVVMKTICVLPERRNVGLMGLYSVRFVEYAESIGARRIFGALTREGNAPFRMMAHAGAPQRWFALYAQAL